MILSSFLENLHLPLDLEDTEQTQAMLELLYDDWFNYYQLHSLTYVIEYRILCCHISQDIILFILIVIIPDFI